MYSANYINYSYMILSDKLSSFKLFQFLRSMDKLRLPKAECNSDIQDSDLFVITNNHFRKILT